MLEELVNPPVESTQQGLFLRLQLHSVVEDGQLRDALPVEVVLVVSQRMSHITRPVDCRVNGLWEFKHRKSRTNTVIGKGLVDAQLETVLSSMLNALESEFELQQILVLQSVSLELFKHQA